MGEKLKVKKSKEKSETMNGYGRLIELPIWFVFVWKDKNSLQISKDFFLGMYAYKKVDFLNLWSLAMWSHAICASRSVFFRSRSLCAMYRPMAQGFSIQVLMRFFGDSAAWILQREKIIDVSSNQVGDVKGNATLIIFSTMPPWLSVHMAMPWP